MRGYEMENYMADYYEVNTYCKNERLDGEWFLNASKTRKAATTGKRKIIRIIISMLG